MIVAVRAGRCAMQHSAGSAVIAGSPSPDFSGMAQFFACGPQRATAIDREDSQSSKRVGPRRGLSPGVRL